MGGGGINKNDIYSGRDQSVCNELGMEEGCSWVGGGQGNCITIKFCKQKKISLPLTLTELIKALKIYPMRVVNELN